MLNFGLGEVILVYFAVVNIPSQMKLLIFLSVA